MDYVIARSDVDIIGMDGRSTGKPCLIKDKKYPIVFEDNNTIGIHSEYAKNHKFDKKDLEEFFYPIIRNSSEKREAVIHLHIYAEQRKGEVDEQTQERLRWMLELIENDGISLNIHEEYMQDV